MSCTYIHIYNYVHTYYPYLQFLETGAYGKVKRAQFEGVQVAVKYFRSAEEKRGYNQEVRNVIKLLSFEYFCVWKIIGGKNARDLILFACNFCRRITVATYMYMCICTRVRMYIILCRFICKLNFDQRMITCMRSYMLSISPVHYVLIEYDVILQLLSGLYLYNLHVYVYSISQNNDFFNNNGNDIHDV